MLVNKALVLKLVEPVKCDLKSKNPIELLIKDDKTHTRELRGIIRIFMQIRSIIMPSNMEVSEWKTLSIREKPFRVLFCGFDFLSPRRIVFLKFMAGGFEFVQKSVILPSREKSHTEIDLRLLVVPDILKTKTG